MKGMRSTTEEKIRILREADGTGRKIQDVCREVSISEQTFYPWGPEIGIVDFMRHPGSSSEVIRQAARGSSPPLLPPIQTQVR